MMVRQRTEGCGIVTAMSEYRFDPPLTLKGNEGIPESHACLDFAKKTQ
jgi:hypothetical protein